MYAFPREHLRALVAACPAVALALLDACARLIGEASDRIEGLALYDVRERLLRTLRRLAGPEQDAVVTLTHEELAALVGTSRERISTVLGQLYRERALAPSRAPKGIRLLGRARRSKW